MNNLRKKYYIACLAFFTVGNTAAQDAGLVRYVNTLQGTNSSYELSYGNTYPTTALPFCMNAWSPQTGKNGDGWKYKFADSLIRGFGETHQCSPWVGDYGVFTLMPVAGALVVDENARASSFKHKNEIAKPNHYKVQFDNGIVTEIAPTERGSHFRFSFPKNKAANVVLDGYTKMSMVAIDPVKKEITGYVTNGAFVPKGFKSYFIIRFDKPFKSYGTWENRQHTISKNNKTAEGAGVGAFVQFADGATIEAKVASSYISAAQAQVTLQRELGTYTSFTQTQNAAAKVWNDLLARVLVEGGTEEEKATFYSCMFRASLFSHQFFEYDANGQPVYYSPYDSKIHDGYMYTDNGFWDTFRSQFPLTNILHPTMQGHYMQALLAAQQQCGWLPAWSAPSETGGMLGNHAISLLADAWAKGIHSFSPDAALKAYYHEATNKGPWGGANGRQGWKEYFQMGFVPYPLSEGSTAQTLEYAYDDFCAYTLAKATGNSFYERIFAKQMYNYKNVFDTGTNFMRGRQANGEWTPNFDPLAWGGPYTEGNAWHYNWSVFHDVQGLINLTGGNTKFIAKIDSVFSQPNTVHVGAYGQTIHEMTEMVNANLGQYAQGNQPIQHLIYLYNYAGEPWKAQAHIREVMAKLYNATENGYPGDEDQGGMSSWYVLSAMGIYSVCPGTDEYVIGSPVFNKVTITMEDGKKFVIEAFNNSKHNVYIQAATLNGKPYTRNWIKYDNIIKGGVLHFEMGSAPNKLRGLQKEDKPFSLSKNTCLPLDKINNGSGLSSNLSDTANMVVGVDTAPYDVAAKQVELPYWAFGPFIRPQNVNPVLAPDTAADFYCPMKGEKLKWEANDVFNPAAVVKDGKIIVLYRAEDKSGKGIGERTSRIGLAESIDGITMQRRKAPVLFPAKDNQKEFEWTGGCEDPRVAVTEDGTYVVLYTQWNKKVPRLAVATSKDLISWRKYGPVFTKAFNGRFFNEATKSASIVTKIIHGKQVIAKINRHYFMYWGEANVYAATSADLINWAPLVNADGTLKILMSPRKGYFDSQLTECGPPAIMTDKGILLLYNGKNLNDVDGDKNYTANSYCAGQALFSSGDPTKLIQRLDKPFFIPTEPFEKSGQYPAGTVFAEGLMSFKNKWFLYYGCADSRVAVAVFDPSDKKN